MSGTTSRGPRRSKVGWLAWALAGVAGALAVAWLSRWTPDPDPAATVCLLRRTAGMDCPGCGMGRAAAALARGDWWSAIRFHPLAVPLAVEIAGGWIAWGLVRSGRLRRPGRGFWPLVAAAHVVAFLLVWAVRGLT